jgi:HAMP domain-containing protein
MQDWPTPVVAAVVVAVDLEVASLVLFVPVAGTRPGLVVAELRTVDEGLESLG